MSAPRRVAAVVLAAGASRRMGGTAKLTADVGGVPLIRRTIENVLSSDAHPVVVVVGADCEATAVALAGLPVCGTFNRLHETGMASSLRAGLRATPDDVDGVLVCLGDMPEVGGATLNRLIAAFDPAAGVDVCAPVFDGRRGNPVLWGRRFFAGLAGLSGDVGARELLAGCAGALRMVAVDDPGVLRDVDAPADLADLRQRLAAG